MMPLELVTELIHPLWVLTARKGLLVSL